jgi:hypothetical protein
VSSDEPEYLKAIKRNAAQKRASDSGQRAAEPARSVPSPAEREATRWAKEVGGREVRVSPGLAGAKVAILVQPITPFGTPPVTLEGLPSREALAERVRAAQGAGENVLGCFELTTGRPLTPELSEGKVTFAAGAPRQIMKPQTPERMIRIAAKQAAELAKSRKLDDRDRGGRGSGGRR